MWAGGPSGQKRSLGQLDGDVISYSVEAAIWVVMLEAMAYGTHAARRCWPCLGDQWLNGTSRRIGLCLPLGAGNNKPGKELRHTARHRALVRGRKLSIKKMVSEYGPTRAT